MVQDTVKELEGCAAEVVLTHLNHTNPLLSKDSNERAMVLAKGFKVGRRAHWKSLAQSIDNSRFLRWIDSQIRDEWFFAILEAMTTD